MNRNNSGGYPFETFDEQALDMIAGYVNVSDIFVTCAACGDRHCDLS